jgi:Saxitoxin biosynthesis operon protein SxtJ
MEPGKRSFNLIEGVNFTVAQARKSTLVVAGVLALLSGWQMYRGHSTAASVLFAASAVLLGCAAIPAAAVFFNKWWMTLAGVLGYVNSRIILSALFFLMVAPIGFLVRRIGHDPLTRRSGNEPSYWRRRPVTRQSHESYERSF